MTSRDDYFRCKVCKRLWKDSDAVIDPDKGYQCPNGCEIPFEQPAYESPLQGNDSNER